MFPFPPLPPIPDWIKDKLGDLGDFVNPFDWFARALSAVYNLLAWFLETILTNPPRFEAEDITDYLYGNAIGVAGLLIFVVTTVLLCVSIFTTRRFLSAIEAIVIGVVIAIAGPLWFVISDASISFGDTASAAMLFYEPSGKNDSLLGFTLDAVTNPLLLIAAFGPTSLLAMLVTLTVFTYELLNVALKVMVLPALALRPLGPKSRAFSDWTFSAFIITSMVGRPVFVFCIELGQLAGDTILGGSTAGTVFFLCAGMVMGLVLQVVLFHKVQKVVAKVSGNTVSRVFGKVETTQKQPTKVNAANVNARNFNSLQPSETYAKRPTETKTEVAKHYVKQETKRVVAAAVAKKAAVAAGAASSGGTTLALGAVATAAGSAATRSKERRDKPRI